jgi:hypothetical protein
VLVELGSAALMLLHNNTGVGVGQSVVNGSQETLLQPPATRVANVSRAAEGRRTDAPHHRR